MRTAAGLHSSPDDEQLKIIRGSFGGGLAPYSNYGKYGGVSYW